MTRPDSSPLPRSAHNPLPWRVGEWSYRLGGFEILDANGESVADGTMALTARAADIAALIVESVNAHASLVERVKELDGALREALDLFEMQEREGRETFSPDGILPKLRALAALGRAK